MLTTNSSNILSKESRPVLSSSLLKLFSEKELPDHLYLVENVDNSEDLTALAKKYEEGATITLVEPTKESLSTLVQSLQIPNSIDPEGLSSVEMIAFSKKESSIFAKPIVGMKIITSTTTKRESPTADNSRIISPNNDENSMETRVSYFLDWAKKNTFNTSMVALADAPQGDPGSLWNEASSSFPIYRIPVEMKTNANTTVTTLFTIQLYAAAICQFASKDRGVPETDWYLATLICSFNPSNAFFISNDTEKGWYVDWYKIAMDPMDHLQDPLANNEPRLDLTSSSPATQNTKDSSINVSCGQADTLSGSVGFFGPTFTANVGYAHTWNYGVSKNITVSSCRVDDYSQDATTNSAGGNNGHWEFTFPDVEFLPGSNSITDPVEYSTAKFSPAAACLWQQPVKNRKNTQGNSPGFRVRCSIDLQFIHAYMDGGSLKYDKYQISTNPSLAQPPSTVWTVSYPPTEEDLKHPKNEKIYTLLSDTQYFANPSEAAPKGTFVKGTKVTFLYNFLGQGNVMWAVVKSGDQDGVFIHGDAIPKG